MRSCGPCQACCFAPRLDERDKPSFTRCRDQGNKRCNDYKGRPDPCRKFKCLWLQGHGDEDDRPDMTGAMLTARNHAEFGPWVSVHLLDKKALGKRRVRDALVKLCVRTVVMELRARDMRMIGGPKDRVARFAAVADEEQVPVHNDCAPLVTLRKRA